MPLGYCATMPLCHYATVPLRHCANVPLCHCATVPLYHYTTMPLRQKFLKNNSLEAQRYQGKFLFHPYLFGMRMSLFFFLN